ncbi:YigZ family protein [Colwellia sp. D2M02]|uniref:YigZ family protein n=1 Tax=Colwellia sp. D2M02 TaxID=2841562 RepID=UPI001C099440|nr:YigZ family protein [Colwellia sp. D2M02]
MTKSYLIATNDVEDELIVSRSRFICYLRPCTSIAQAKSMLKELQQLHPQASHHCHAFLTKAADNSQGYGFSDDGEPSGTAGKPMLSVLQGGGIGEVCAVVVRYFGGTKLGTGGLQRAYGGSVRQALTFLQSKIKIAMVHKTLACQYSQVDDVLHVLKQFNGEILAQDYQQQVFFRLAIPADNLLLMQTQLQTMSAGQLVLISENNTIT